MKRTLKIGTKHIAIVIALVAIAGVAVFMMNNQTPAAGTTEPEQASGSSIVVLETNRGTIKIELFLGQSPITAGNFKKLVEEKFYDGTRFHRVIQNFMIQGGDPNTKSTDNVALWGTGNAGYAIQDEFVQGLSNVRGSISMANSGPSSGSSQFFINVNDNTALDWDKQPSSSKHPVFGKVVEGMEIVDEISRTATTGPPSDRPVEDVVIERAFIE